MATPATPHVNASGAKANKVIAPTRQRASLHDHANILVDHSLRSREPRPAAQLQHLMVKISDIAAGIPSVLDTHQQCHRRGNEHIDHRAAYDPQLQDLSVHTA